MPSGHFLPVCTQHQAAKHILYSYSRTKAGKSAPLGCFPQLTCSTVLSTHWGSGHYFLLLFTMPAACLTTSLTLVYAVVCQFSLQDDGSAVASFSHWVPSHPKNSNRHDLSCSVCIPFLMCSVALHTVLYLSKPQFPYL